MPFMVSVSPVVIRLYLTFLLPTGNSNSITVDDADNMDASVSASLIVKVCPVLTSLHRTILNTLVVKDQMSERFYNHRQQHSHRRLSAINCHQC